MLSVPIVNAITTESRMASIAEITRRFALVERASRRTGAFGKLKPSFRLKYGQPKNSAGQVSRNEIATTFSLIKARQQAITIASASVTPRRRIMSETLTGRLRGPHKHDASSKNRKVTVVFGTRGIGEPGFVLRLLGVSGSVLDPDRRSYKSKSFPNLVFEKALVGKVQLDGAVGEKYERGRSNRGLRHVQNFHALAHRDGCPFEIHPLNEAVHLRGGHALAPLGGNLFEQRKDLFRALAALGGDENDGRVIQKL